VALIVKKIIFPKRLFALSLIFSAALLYSVVSGCGKKTPPLPPASLMPPAVTGLKATSDGPYIFLNWQLENRGKVKPSGFIIYRGDAACRVCPVRFKPIASIPFRSEQVYTYVDTPGPGPGHYVYRIRCEDGYGIEGPAATVEVDLPGMDKKKR